MCDIITRVMVLVKCSSTLVFVRKFDVIYIFYDKYINLILMELDHSAQRKERRWFLRYHATKNRSCVDALRWFARTHSMLQRWRSLVFVEATAENDGDVQLARAHGESRKSIKRHTARANSDYYEAARSYGRRLIISPVQTLLLSLLL